MINKKLIFIVGLTLFLFAITSCGLTPPLEPKVPVVPDPVLDPVVLDPVLDPVVLDPVDLDPVVPDPVLDPVVPDPVVPVVPPVEDGPNELSGLDSIEGDRQALVDIYTITNGDKWKRKDNWLSNKPLGEWYGIKTDEEGRVIHVDLEQNGLANAILVVDSQGNPVLDKQRGEILKFIEGREFPESVRNLKRVKYFNVKANYLSGPIPQGFMEMRGLEYLLLSGRAQQDPKVNDENHPGKRRHIVRQNQWTGELPRDWSKLTNLFAIQISNHESEHGLVGELPQTLFDLPNIHVIELYSNRFTGNIPEITNPEKSKIVFIAITEANLEGPLPESWSKLSAPYGKYFRFDGNKGLTGPIPESYANIQNIRVFLSEDTALTGPFPAFLFHDGNNLMTYFSLHNNVMGALPAELPAKETTFPHITIFRVVERGLTGQIPNWAANMGQVQFHWYGNKFSSLADEFYNPDANVYRVVRLMHVENNELKGELPDVVFAGKAFDGRVQSMSNSKTVKLDMNLGVVETGAITQASSDWIQDSSKQGIWKNNWIDHNVKIINPNGPNYEFEVLVDWNFGSGYLYPRGQITPSSQLAGLEFTISPIVVDRVIRFKLGENKWVARRIVSQNTQTNEVVLDKPLDIDVTGLSYTIHKEISAISYNIFSNNKFTGSIPQSWGYIPTDRNLILSVAGNELTGIVPDLSNIGRRNVTRLSYVPSLGADYNQGNGSLDSLSYQNNRFTFKDILPNFAANDAAANRHTYAPQKPFGEVKTITRSVGQSFSVDYSKYHYAGNVYQWFKGGTAISGATSHTLNINNLNSGHAGAYTLRIMNPAAPSLTLTSEITTLKIN